jgi:hypothetical protein
MNNQGGQVASDVFCGGSDNKPLTMSLVKDSGEHPCRHLLQIQKLNEAVVAVIVFGDPSHVANLTYDRGNSKNDGVSVQGHVVKRISTLTLDYSSSNATTQSCARTTTATSSARTVTQAISTAIWVTTTRPMVVTLRSTVKRWSILSLSGMRRR